MSRIRSSSEIKSNAVQEILAGSDPRGGMAPVTIAEKRSAYQAASQRAGTPTLVARIHNHQLPVEGTTLTVRVYEDSEVAAGSTPVIVYLHGGGFVSGNLLTHDPVCRALSSQAKATVVAVDYRLAPEHPFPAALQDCHSAIRWASERWSGAPLFVAGDSAGGNLAAATALWARDCLPPLDLAGQILIYPALDATLSSGSLIENALVPPFTLLDCVFMWQQYLPDRTIDRRDPFISPLHAPTLAGLPETLLITAEFDILKAEGAAFGNRLRSSGVAVQHLEVPDMPHGFLQWGGTVPEAGVALHRIARFVTLAASASNAHRQIRPDS